MYLLCKTIKQSTIIKVHRKVILLLNFMEITKLKVYL